MYGRSVLTCLVNGPFANAGLLSTAPTYSKAGDSLQKEFHRVHVKRFGVGTAAINRTKQESVFIRNRPSTTLSSWMYSVYMSITQWSSTPPNAFDLVSTYPFGAGMKAADLQTPYSRCNRFPFHCFPVRSGMRLFSYDRLNTQGEKGKRLPIDTFMYYIRKQRCLMPQSRIHTVTSLSHSPLIALCVTKHSTTFYVQLGLPSVRQLSTSQALEFL